MAGTHLDKVLRHAAKRLAGQSFGNPKDLLEVYRRFLKVEEHRLKLDHNAGAGGGEVAQKRAGLITVVLQHLWRGAYENALKAHIGTSPSLMLMAVGGFGRGELNPFSDVDILFVHGAKTKREMAAVSDIVEQVLYLLWDVGFKVGHATRKLDDVFLQANEDLQTKTSLLEARYIDGDKNLWEEFERGFDRHCIKGKEMEYLDWRLRDQTERHTKHGGTVYLQEPNVKTGCGGLRDYHSLIWIARVKRGYRSTAEIQEAGLLTPSERKQIEAAHDFLLRLRNELHFQQKRGGDIMTLRLQGLIANHFRYQHRTILRRTEALMRVYYQHARFLFDVTNTLGRRLAGEADSPKRKSWAFLPRRAVKPTLVDEFYLNNGVLELPDLAKLSADPLLIVKVYALAQQHGAELAPELEMGIRRRLPQITRSFIYQIPVREMLLSIFSRKGQVGRVLRMMHKVGLLGKLFPEFAPLDCLVQHEFFHQYTADEHTLQCIDMLDKIIGATEKPFSAYINLMQSVERPHVLYLAMLLHDTGKSANSRHHSDDSAQNAVRVARRFKLPQEELSALVFLVDHHLTMMETARRRNLDEVETINDFARIVQNTEKLDLLMLLTFADGQGTSSLTTWSDWKELLLWQLYRRTREALTGQHEFVEAAQASLDQMRGRVRALLKSGDLTVEEIDAHFLNLPNRYFHALTDEEVARHLRLVHEFLWKQFTQEDTALQPVIEWFDHEDQAHSEFTLVSWDRERLFARVTGSFAAAGISILSADVYTRADHIVIDTFRVATDRWQAVSDPRDKNKVNELIKKAFSLDAVPKPEEMKKPAKGTDYSYDDRAFPTRVTFDLKSSSDHTVLDVQTPDRPGLLYRIALILADAGLRVIFARITTEKGAALDTFYLTDDHGRKVEDGVWLDALSRRLSKALG